MGSRVRSITIAGKEAEPSQELILATNDFLAQGGNGYPHLAARPKLQSWMRFEAALVQYLQQGESTRPFVADGRIRRVP